MHTVLATFPCLVRKVDVVRHLDTKEKVGLLGRLLYSMDIGFAKVDTLLLGRAVDLGLVSA